VSRRARSEFAKGDKERTERTNTRDDDTKRIPKTVKANVAADGVSRMEIWPPAREEKGNGKGDHKDKSPAPYPPTDLGTTDAREDDRSHCRKARDSETGRYGIVTWDR
jgi:hypothetical protein